MLPPLDEVPVHVHRFAARAPCDSKGSECQCGIHTAETASALRSRKTERAAKEKPTPISPFFLAPAAPGTPTRRHALGRLPAPPPLPENLLSDCTENCPLRPCERPGGFGIRKSASNSGHSPLRGLGGGLGGGLGDASPARRGSRSRTASPPASLAIRKAPSASVESIEPRSPQPCEVGRPKGRRRKNRRQSHRFFLAPAAPWHPNAPPRPGEAPHPAPSARKSATQTAQKTALCAPASTQEVSELLLRPMSRYSGLISEVISGVISESICES